MQIQASISINKSVKDVWDYAMNPKYMNEWVEGFVSLKLLEGESGKEGAKYKRTHKETGINFSFIEEIIEVNLYQDFITSIENKYALFKLHFKFVEIGNSTKIILTYNIELKSVFYKVGFAFWKQLMLKRQENSFEKLKKILETKTN